MIHPQEQSVRALAITNERTRHVSYYYSINQSKLNIIAAKYMNNPAYSIDYEIISNHLIVERHVVVDATIDVYNLDKE